MRRVFLLALLALALPTVALADSIDFAFGGKLGHYCQHHRYGDSEWHLQRDFFTA